MLSKYSSVFLTLFRLLDTSHTICIWVSLWGYLIEDYGNAGDINNISR